MKVSRFHNKCHPLRTLKLFKVLHDNGCVFSDFLEILEEYILILVTNKSCLLVKEVKILIAYFGLSETFMKIKAGTGTKCRHESPSNSLNFNSLKPHIYPWPASVSVVLLSFTNHPEEV